MTFSFLNSLIGQMSLNSCKFTLKGVGHHPMTSRRDILRYQCCYV